MSRVCVHGLGHVGLPTAALLALAGHPVTGHDIAPALVARVNAGASGFAEPGLDALLARVIGSGALRATTCPATAEVHIIAVPTPLAADRRADLSAVWQVAAAIAPLLRGEELVILESTVPVGTTEALAARLPPGVAVAHVPERVLPGRALQELVHNDRVVGGLDQAAASRAATLYRAFVRGALVETDARTAELVKLAENAYRDVNIAFANELAAICERVGVEARHAIALANRHPRVNILSPGTGVGGHCIPVDPWFLAQAAPEDSVLIRAARSVNDAVPQRVLAQIRAACARFPAPRVACLGLAYKPDVEDVRESPAMAVAQALLADGLPVVVSDPFVSEVPQGAVRREAAEAIAGADVVAVLVPHTVFRALDSRLFAGKAVVDPVGLLG
ncbi:nucleotide sugar dehydrogenase [Roseomonas sp. AR75]|uniref:nucleotide sugar dehydrogenase n=1 Tax=Roseomonas sp. AR75 TaxID=2562311 RepID=UPI00197EBD7E|nr:nucleotide sugar dehydrogenase [Roseomonas sp. AR75]